MTEPRNRFTDRFLDDDNHEMHIGDAIRAIDVNGKLMGFYRIVEMRNGTMRRAEITEQEAGEDPHVVTFKRF